jgi:hypothetical protein
MKTQWIEYAAKTLKQTWLTSGAIILGIHGSWASPFDPPLHLDLELSSAKYSRILASQKTTTPDEPAISNALTFGQRLAKWIELENSRRAPEQAIRLTSAQTRTGIPMDQPSQYSPALIEERMQFLLTEMPDSIKTVITQRVPYPDSMPVDDATFILYGRRLDRLYQSAARWKTLKPYLSYYVQAQNKDVRGYAVLQKRGWNAETLKQYPEWSTDEKTQAQNALFGICLNATQNRERCQNEVQTRLSVDTPAPLAASLMYEAYIEPAKQNWDSFFKIPQYARRGDLTWNTSTAPTAWIPFHTPTSTRIQNYLQLNIEDEFKWEDFQLRLQFGNFINGPRVLFESGVVPHVNGLGGNEIVMDENQPIEEYESQWTIRHEFAHVLGLPDCYHEFYDTQIQAFVNYQIDTTDLMCSRAGNMNERIYLELKQAYFLP